MIDITSVKEIKENKILSKVYLNISEDPILSKLIEEVPSTISKEGINAPILIELIKWFCTYSYLCGMNTKKIVEEEPLHTIH